MLMRSLLQPECGLFQSNISATFQLTKFKVMHRVASLCGYSLSVWQGRTKETFLIYLSCNMSSRFFGVVFVFFNQCLLNGIDIAFVSCELCFLLTNHLRSIFTSITVSIKSASKWRYSIFGEYMVSCTSRGQCKKDSCGNFDLGNTLYVVLMRSKFKKAPFLGKTSF